MKTVVEKLLSMVTLDDGVKRLRWFLRGAEVNLDSKYYDRMAELRESLINTLNIDPNEIPDGKYVNPETGEETIIPKEKYNSMFSTDRDGCFANANLYIFLYVVGDVEDVIKKYGVTDVLGTIAHAKKLIKANKYRIKLEIQEKLDKTFIELEKSIGNFSAASSGHPEGIYQCDDEIMDLDKRGVTIKPDTKEENASEEDTGTLSKNEKIDETLAEDNSEKCELCEQYGEELNEETKKVLDEFEEHRDDPEWCKENLISFDNTEDAFKFLESDIDDVEKVGVDQDTTNLENYTEPEQTEEGSTPSQI